MPVWLIDILKWGGVIVAIVSAIALIYVQYLMPEGGEVTVITSAPLTLYWVLLVVGVVAAIIGFVMDRRKGQPTSSS
jgi:hypothetical protein